jgi:hypothetical protein
MQREIRGINWIAHEVTKAKLGNMGTEQETGRTELQCHLYAVKVTTSLGISFLIFKVSTDD